MSKRALFGRSKAIERKIDAFLDQVSEAGLVLVAILHHSLDSGGGALREEERRRIEQMLEIKRASSGLRREIESELYGEMLIPDLLGDVASLIESLHHLVESMHHVMRFGSYSRLPAPEFLQADGKELATAVGSAVDALVQAARAFFRDYTHVRDHVHKVAFFESESDTVRDRLLEQIYDMDTGLAEKDHFGNAVRNVDSVADAAERIADTLTIYAIKRAE